MYTSPHSQLPPPLPPWHPPPSLPLPSSIRASMRLVSLHHTWVGSGGQDLVEGGCVCVTIPLAACMQGAGEGRERERGFCSCCLRKECELVSCFQDIVSGILSDGNVFSKIFIECWEYPREFVAFQHVAVAMRGFPFVYLIVILSEILHDVRFFFSIKQFT